MGRSEFTGHEGQDTVIVRGSMHHAAMTVSEFEDWLIREGCQRRAWTDMGDGAMARTTIHYADGAIRSIALRVEDSLFEQVPA